MKKTLLGLVLLLGMGCGGSGAKPPPPSSDAAQAAYDRQAWSDCSRMYRERLAGFAWDRDGNAYNAACCDARGGRIDDAFDLLARSGYEDADHAAEDPDLLSLHADPRWPRFLDAARAAHAAAERTLRKDLVDDLAARVKVDQEARRAYMAAPSKEIGAKIMKIDHENTEALKAMVASVGWPGRSLVGEQGAHDAWLLAQHADQDHAFQKQVLALLEPLVARGEVAPNHFAYLYDRVAVAEKRPQRFGTQGDTSGDPGALEDPSHVDARRAAYDMGPIAEYQATLRKLYGPK